MAVWTLQQHAVLMEDEQVEISGDQMTLIKSGQRGRGGP